MEVNREGELTLILLKPNRFGKDIQRVWTGNPETLGDYPERFRRRIQRTWNQNPIFLQSKYKRTLKTTTRSLTWSPKRLERKLQCQSWEHIVSVNISMRWSFQIIFFMFSNWLLCDRLRCSHWSPCQKPFGSGDGRWREFLRRRSRRWATLSWRPGRMVMSHWPLGWSG